MGKSSNFLFICFIVIRMRLAAFGVFGFACGAMSGGFIMRKLKLNGRQAALFLLFVSAINTGSFVAKSFFGCHSTVNSIGLAGVPTNFNYTNECNQECGCQNVRLFPVCDKTGKFHQLSQQPNI
jgi:hypothetical protein